MFSFPNGSRFKVKKAARFDMIFRSIFCSIPLLFMTENDCHFDRKGEGEESLISKRESSSYRRDGPCHIELKALRRHIKMKGKSIISKRKFGLSLI